MKVKVRKLKRAKKIESETFRVKKITKEMKKEIEREKKEIERERKLDGTSLSLKESLIKRSILQVTLI